MLRRHKADRDDGTQEKCAQQGHDTEIVPLPSKKNVHAPVHWL